MTLLWIFLAVFASDGVGVPAFRPLPRLRTDEVADLLQIIRARVMRFLTRRGVVDVPDDATAVPDELADKEPALAQLAAAAVSGLPPAGPERRRPIVIALPGRPGVQVQAPLSVAELGFSTSKAGEPIPAARSWGSPPPCGRAPPQAPSGPAPGNWTVKRRGWQTPVCRAPLSRRRVS